MSELQKEIFCILCGWVRHRFSDDYDFSWIKDGYFIRRGYGTYTYHTLDEAYASETSL